MALPPPRAAEMLKRGINQRKRVLPAERKGFPRQLGSSSATTLPEWFSPINFSNCFWKSQRRLALVASQRGGEPGWGECCASGVAHVDHRSPPQIQTPAQRVEGPHSPHGEHLSRWKKHRSCSSMVGRRRLRASQLPSVPCRPHVGDDPQGDAGAVPQGVSSLSLPGWPRWARWEPNASRS